ncbi:SU10 major capsid protein [Klebsiella pneumoniae]
MAFQNTSAMTAQHKNLSDVVSNISPEDTPFMTLIGKGTVDNVLFYWAEEELAKVGANAAKEGADAKDHVDNLLIERNNYTQIFTKTVKLSGSSMVNAIAGNKQKLANQVELRAKELKRDMEFAFVGTGQVKTGETSTVGRMTAGFQAQVDSANIIDKAGVAVTEDDLNEVLVRIFEQGGTPDYIMCHPRIRAAIVAILSAKEGRIRDIANGTELVNDIKDYTSSVGSVKIINNRWAKYDATTGVGDIMVFDSSMWSVESLRPYSLSELAKTGDYEARQLVTEVGLKNKSFKSSGLITNVKV